MAQLFPRHDHSPERWLRRLERAADGMNPFLTVLAIGLVVLNLTCVALQASRWPITHHTPGFAACLPSPASAPGAETPPAGDIKAWTY